MKLFLDCDSDLWQDEDDHDKSEGFWREFFLLKPDKATLHKILDDLNPDDLLHLQVLLARKTQNVSGSDMVIGANAPTVFAGSGMYKVWKCTGRCACSRCKIWSKKFPNQADGLDHYSLPCLGPPKEIHEPKFRHNKCSCWFGPGRCSLHRLCCCAGRYNKDREKL